MVGVGSLCSQATLVMPGCLQLSQAHPRNPLVCAVLRRAAWRGKVLRDKHVQCREKMERFTFLKATAPHLTPTVHQCVEVRTPIHSPRAQARGGRFSRGEVRGRLFPEAPVSVCADSMESFQAMTMWYPLFPSRKIHDMVRNGPAQSAREGAGILGRCPLWWSVHLRQHNGSKCTPGPEVETIPRVRRGD